MATKQKTASVESAGGRRPGELRRQYGCGPVEFTGNEHALYERHLMFDDVVNPATGGLRDRFEAVARSVRDVLCQRWVRTEETYERESPIRLSSRARSDPQRPCSRIQPTYVLA